MDIKMKRKKMNNGLILLTGSLAALLFTGCAAKKENPMVTSARESLAMVQNDVEVNKYAPLELQDAKTAFANVEKSLAAEEDMAQVEHLA